LLPIRQLARWCQLLPMLLAGIRIQQHTGRLRVEQPLQRGHLEARARQTLPAAIVLPIRLRR
jgi:hypothetical protein